MKSMTKKALAGLGILTIASQAWAVNSAPGGRKVSVGSKIGAASGNKKRMMAGREGTVGNGGDSDALAFEADAHQAVTEIQASVSSYPELKSVNLHQILSQTRVLVSDHPLVAEKDGVEQESSAINYHGPDTIVLNRARWHAIPSEAIRKALAIHELLGLAGVEGTGDYVVSQRYLDASSPKDSGSFGHGKCGANLGCLEKKWAKGNPPVGTDLGYRYAGGWGCTRREGNNLKPGYNPGFLGECGDLRGTDMNQLAEKLGKIREINDRVVFEGVNLRGALMDGVNLRYLDFERVNFEAASMKGADVRNAQFREANLDNTDFSGADLTAAQLDRALIGRTHFEKARLIGTDLSDTTAYDGEFTGALIDDDTVFPKKFGVADFTTALPADERADYEPGLNSSVEVLLQGRKVIVNRETTQAQHGGDDQVIPWSAQSEVKGASMCFRGDPLNAWLFMAGTFQEDGEWCDGNENISDSMIKFTGCNGEYPQPQPDFELVIPRCQ